MHSGFARGQLDTTLSRRDLHEWQLALDALDAGHSVRWMDTGRQPEIQVERTGESSRYVEVAVIDEVGSMTWVRIAVCLPEGWLDDHRARQRRPRTVSSRIGERALLIAIWGRHNRRPRHRREMTTSIHLDLQ